MGPVNDGVFDRPPRRKSFVERMAMKTKSQVYNFKSYKTISLLPKFLVSPDSGTWTRFDQDTRVLDKHQEQQTSFDTILEMPEHNIPENTTSDPNSNQQRRNSSIADRLFNSRLLLPFNYIRGNKPFRVQREPGSISTLTEPENANQHIKKSKFFNRNTNSSDSSEAISERITRINPDISFIPDESRKEPDWKPSSTKEGEEYHFADGFWKECQSEMYKSWHIFTGETTAHGYKRTMAAHRTKLGRIAWAIAILGVTSMVVAVLYITMVGQDLYAFSSSIKSQPYQSMDFPAVTVCSLAPYDFSRIDDTILRNYTDQINRFLLQVAALRNVSNADDSGDSLNFFREFDTKQLHELIGWRLDDFIKQCLWNDVQIPCSEMFVESMTVTESCFTFNSDPDRPYTTQRVGSFSGLSLIIDVGNDKEALQRHVTSGLKVLMHEPNEFPNTRENGMLISPGTTTYINVARNEYKFLPYPFKAYGTHHCSDATSNKDGDDSGKYYNYTGYSSCVAECRLRSVLDKCACVVYGRDPTIPGVRYCTMDEYIKCYIPTLRESFMLYQSMQKLCHCPLPCNKVEYPIQISSAAFQRTVEGVAFLEQNTWSSGLETDDFKNYVELKIFYKELFTHIEEHIPMYTWLSIFGNVGGQLGLFAGASVLTVLEFLELAVVIVWLVSATSYRYIKNRWKSDTVQLTHTWRSDNGAR